MILGLGRTTGLISERLRQHSKAEDDVFEAPVETFFERYGDLFDRRS